MPAGILTVMHKIFRSLWDYCHLNSISLPNYDYRTSFDLFRFSLISFNSVLWFSVHKLYICFIKFISKHFILLDAIINRIIFLISFSNC
jgi:hypothetical protein